MEGGRPHPDPAEQGRPIADRAEVVALYRRDLEQGRLPVDVDTIRAELAGRDLACWCPPADSNAERLSCHGDLLLRIANQPPAEEWTVSDRSGIEWTDTTWNPTTGCDRVSAGCTTAMR